MSTENIDDGNDHSWVVALHCWLYSTSGDRLKMRVQRPACCDGAQKINIDDQHGNNVLKLRQHRFGRNVSKSDLAVFHEPSLEVVTSRQREQYFSVGHETHAPSDQIDIILHVAGEKGWNSSGERMRRREHWRIALTGGNASGDEHHRLRPSKAGIN